jgi:internalin A
VWLERLTIKDARYLERLDGIEASDLAGVQLQGAPRLRDVSALLSSRSSLAELRLENARSLNSLDDIGQLGNLCFLEIGDCGHIDSVRPLSGLNRLEVLDAWGTTEVLDGDLTPLAHLPALRELRIRPRRSYTPDVRDIPAAVF